MIKPVSVSQKQLIEEIIKTPKVSRKFVNKCQTTPQIVDAAIWFRLGI